ncbi:MAG: GntR family transcriptional regulator, partial [Alphaproteobacteria bacterium]|nr:GntR family transcriptional regulator [Alphaproteobacteria bacterium]
LDALVYLGFVDRHPNRGVVVRRRTLEEILRLFDMREVNEGLCARIAAANVPPGSWDDLIELFGAPMEAVAERKDLHAYVQHYELLRRRLIEAADAPPLADLLHRLCDMTDIFVRRVLISSDRAQHALHDHRAVLEALRRNDAEAAERMRRATIANIRTAVERYSAFVL